MWFAHLESQFSLASIIDAKTKFHHVVSAIEGESSTYVADVVTDNVSLKLCPWKKRHRMLLNRLIQQFLEYESIRIHSLLCDMTLGDQNPSQLLRKMYELISFRKKLLKCCGCNVCRSQHCKS